MRHVFKEMRAAEKHDQIDESRESVTENVTTRNLFLKSGSESDLYQVLKKFQIIPLE